MKLFRPLPETDRAAWRARVEKDLVGKGPESLATALPERIDVQVLYDAGDVPTDTHAERPLRDTPGWDVFQEHHGPDPSAVNRAITAERTRGVTGVWLVTGPAPSGIAIAGLADLDAVLTNVPLDETNLVLDGGQDPFARTALLLALAQNRRVPPQRLRGCLGADPIGTLLADGRLPTSLPDALAAARAIAAWSADQSPGLRAVLVSTIPHREAGATAVEELGWSIATAVAYVRAGVSPDEILFASGIGTDLFAEIAKLRALRLLWPRALDAPGTPPTTARAPMRIHARTLVRTTSTRDAHANALRETIACCAAALGGADAITTRPFDATLGTPDDAARRLASNTQHILGAESHLADLVDPAAGSFYLESLTHALAEAGWDRFRAIESLGGMARAVQNGEVQKQATASAEARAKAIEERRRTIVGVTAYADENERPLARPVPDRDAAWSAATRRADAAAGGAAARALEALASARADAGTDLDALLDAAADAACAGATRADLGAALGTGSDPASAPRLLFRRDAEPYETQR